jgi:hypothetical protein
LIESEFLLLPSSSFLNLLKTESFNDWSLDLEAVGLFMILFAISFTLSESGSGLCLLLLIQAKIEDPKGLISYVWLHIFYDSYNFKIYSNLWIEKKGGKYLK